MIDRRPRTAPISMFALGPLLGAALAAPALAQDGPRETLCFNALHARLGADAPDGTGITVGYAEPPANGRPPVSLGQPRGLVNPGA